VLDIDSVGHGVETVTVAKVGTPSSRGSLLAAVSPGVTAIKVQAGRGGGAQALAFTVGDKLTVGTPGIMKPLPSPRSIRRRRVISRPPSPKRIRQGGGSRSRHRPRPVRPAEVRPFGQPPFSDRGTGITFKPATAFAHSSNEPIQALGAGITLDSPLTGDHAIDAPVRDSRTPWRATPRANQTHLSPGNGSEVQPSLPPPAP